MDKKRDVIVSEEVYWALVKRKFTDQYRSIDEVLRPMLGICPGARARTRSYEREMEYMKEKLSDGDPSGECPTRTQGEAIILSFFREIRFLYETVLKGGGTCQLR